MGGEGKREEEGKGTESTEEDSPDFYLD